MGEFPSLLYYFHTASCFLGCQELSDSLQD